MNASMLENARLLGDRRLAEEALDLPARSRFGEGRAEPFIVLIHTYILHENIISNNKND